MIRRAGSKDLLILRELFLALWPDHDATEMETELAVLLSRNDVAIFLACNDAEAIGFAQCQLRRDYVEGTQSSPVGYLEGIYVTQEFRHQGTAGLLLKSCENWAREQGCKEFASDCELNNEGSLQFHLKMGFEEANRIICFTKRL